MRMSLAKAQRLVLVSVLFTSLSPTVALAQAAGIGGVVRDSSGGVMPGVTVEAASPALIEKSRSAVTDSDGQYKIVDLRAGEYPSPSRCQDSTSSGAKVSC